MRMVGYCVKCRRIKQVRVDPRSLVGGGTPTGVCAQCEQEGR